LKLRFTKLARFNNTLLKVSVVSNKLRYYEKSILTYVKMFSELADVINFIRTLFKKFGNKLECLLPARFTRKV
jgi:hypothetical protein